MSAQITYEEREELRNIGYVSPFGCTYCVDCAKEGMPVCEVLPGEICDCCNKPFAPVLVKGIACIEHFTCRIF